MGERGGPAPYGRQAQHGLSPEREQQLLALWEAQAGQGQS